MHEQKDTLRECEIGTYFLGLSVLSYVFIVYGLYSGIIINILLHFSTVNIDILFGRVIFSYIELSFITYIISHIRFSKRVFLLAVHTMLLLLFVFIVLLHLVQLIYGPKGKQVQSCKWIDGWCGHPSFVEFWNKTISRRLILGFVFFVFMIE